MKRVDIAFVLVGLVFLWGCGSGDEPIDGGKDTQPPVSAADGSGDAEATDGNGAATDPPIGTTVEQQPGDGGDAVASARKVAEGQLAAHSTALSMITPNHFAVIKLDVDKIRNASLIKKLPAKLEDLVRDEMGPGMDEVVRETETIWVALSPGAGNLGDMFGSAGHSEPKVVDERFHEGEFEEDFDPDGGEFDEFDAPPKEAELPCGEDPDADGETVVDPFGRDFDDPSATVTNEPGNEDFDDPIGDHHPDGFGPPEGEMPPPPVNVSVYARFKTAEALNEFLANAPPMERTVEIAYGGDSYLKTEGAPLWIRIRDRELVASTDESVLKGYIDAKGKLVDSPLIDRLQETNVDAHLVICATMDPIAEQVSDVVGDPDAGLPPQVKGVAEAISAVSLAIDLEGPQMFDLNVAAADGEKAKLLHDMVQGVIGMGSDGLAEGQTLIDQGAAPEGADEMLAFGKKVLGAIAVKQEGSQLAVSLARPDGLESAVDKAVAAAQVASKAAMKANNGRMLALAAFNYEATIQKMPTNVEQDGKQILSWRVQLLPYLEAFDLFEEFQIDEAWDSDNNKPLLENMPPILATASVTEPGMTTWRMLPTAPGPQRAGQILFIDAGKGKQVPWTQPDEFTIDPTDPLASLGEEPDGGYMAVFGDGHIEAMSSEAIKTHFAGQEGNAGPPDTVDPIVIPPIEDPTLDDPVVDDAADEVREWVDSTGTRKVKATLVKIEDGKVTLRRADNGTEVTLPIDKLSDADQEYLKVSAEP